MSGQLVRVLPWLLAPVVIGTAAGAAVQVTEPGIMFRATAAPGLLGALAGLLGTSALGAVFAARCQTAKAASAAARAAAGTAAQERLRFLLRLDHELKNPLTAIWAGLANIEHAGAAAAEENSAEAALANVSAQVNRITRLLGDLRRLSELETREIAYGPVDMPALLQEVEEVIGALPDWGERAIRVSVPRAPWPLPLIEGDRDLLLIVLQNLVANAVKFSAPGDIIEIRASEDGDWLLLEVADTGLGIPPDEMGEVWQELARGRAARSIPGTGIGLALVKIIVARHGGQVSIRSQEGRGTVIAIRLPIPIASAITQARTAARPAIRDRAQHAEPATRI